jgi:hypothetical protein
MGKTEIVSARLHKSTKEKLLETGYNPAQAIEWFVYKFSTDRESIERDMMRIKLESLRNNEHNLKHEIKILEEVLMTD